LTFGCPSIHGSNRLYRSTRRCTSTSLYFRKRSHAFGSPSITFNHRPKPSWLTFLPTPNCSLTKSSLLLMNLNFFLTTLSKSICAEGDGGAQPRSANSVFTCLLSKPTVL